MRALLAAAAAALLSACAAGHVSLGPGADGYGVEVAAPTLPEARRQAVSEFFDLYLSSPAAVQPVLDEKILGKPETFIAREKAKTEGDRVTLRALVDYRKLGRALDEAGLVRPAGVKGRPAVSVSVAETGPGADAHAADALLRGLKARGYSAAAAGQAAEIAVSGRAEAAGSADKRLSGFGSCAVKLSVQAAQQPAGTLAAKADQEASAIEVNDAAACAKALDSAGELAADKVAAALGSIYQERSEFTVTVLNLGNLDRSRELLAAARGLPRVAAAAFDETAGGDVRLKIWSDKMGADDMTAELLKLKQFKLEVRAVDPSYNEIQFGRGDYY